jgi:hypothetical protein
MRESSWYISKFLQVFSFPFFFFFFISMMPSQLREPKIDKDKRKEDSFWGFDPVSEIDSGNSNEEMEADGSKKQRSALASSEYPAKLFHSPQLPILEVSSAIHSQEPKTWATRSTDALDTENAQKEDEYWGFDPVLRSSTNLSMKNDAMEGS